MSAKVYWRKARRWRWLCRDHDKPIRSVMTFRLRDHADVFAAMHNEMFHADEVMTVPAPVGESAVKELAERCVLQREAKKKAQK